MPNNTKDSTEARRPKDTTEIAIATHYFEQLYLYAFATQAEVKNHIRTQCAQDEVDRLPEIMGTWTNLQQKVTEIVEREARSRTADTAAAAPIPIQFNQRTLEFSENELFQKTFAGLPVSFGVVEVDRLVSPQRTVNLDYARRLIGRFAKSPTMADLIEICLSPQREMDPIQHLEVAPNTHVFSSPNSDIRFLGAFVKHLTPDDLKHAVSGGLPGAAVIAFIGYGGAPVNVIKIGNRIVLNNGFHRVYALRSIGIERIPVVIQHVRNPQLEFPDQVAGLPKAYLLGVPRPALVKDFFEPDFQIALKVKERIKMITIGIGLNQHEVPA